MVNYEYRDIIKEILAGQDLVRECSERGEEIEQRELFRTLNAIAFYQSKKGNFSSQQRTGLDLLVQSFYDTCYPEKSAEEVA